ncbi:protein of unknown function [Maribacter dokdonensis]|uniref:DUF4365 domain-containing protein n=1 Tax=Maribacter dokdonensis TaxID=320912 RepID=A0ABY0UB09_9FLAO|nr:DUF4365 domain-containing protein [Maribacter dokdonensis]SDS37381.1 protein of unknown function [Maribacter dokdonensis]
MLKRPIRDRNRVLERNSRVFFENNIPQNWTLTVPSEDYGVDLIINVFEDQHPAYDFDVQLKASEKSIGGNFEKAILKISTYNYLINRLHVVMLIKYCEEEKEAYWILMSHIPVPNQNQKTFTVNIPKSNKITELDWETVKAYIKEVVDYKLCAGEQIKKIIKQRNG